MAQYLGSAAAFSGAYVIIRASAYAFVLLACRGIGCVGWEHRLPIAPSAMLRTRIRASNVTLMGCASGSQSHAAGDEPLGITTALLCAGASSMTGTMWKADVDTALAFTDRFLATLAKERRDAQAGVVDLARVVQKAVCRLKKRPETSAPFHWASFLLHGSWVLEK